MYRIEAMGPIHVPGVHLARERLLRQLGRGLAARPMFRTAEIVHQNAQTGGLQFVAKVGHEVVGWCMLTQASSSDGQAILELGVAAPWRTQGIESALLDTVMQLAKQASPRILFVSAAWDGDLIDCLERAGFMQARGANGLPEWAWTASGSECN
ncbi:MAG: GNAT family N-acetyltransferase [Burkholderiales bacterium]|nr:GNAT family N-acetyltransferase [Burkholderiales bacterium]